MKVFLDTNIIIDFFDNGREHYQSAAILFDLAKKGKLELIVCAQSFVNAYYVVGKYYPKKDVIESMRELYKLCSVSPIDASIIEQALAQESIDFEDTVQYLSSATADADVIITRDQHGFNDFPIQHISAEQFLDNYIQKP